MIIANRNVERARALAHRFQGFAIGLEEIPSHLADADMIIAATASPDPLLSEIEMKVAMKLRRNRPVFIADLAVPRDVEAKVAKLADVYLYTVDDLQNVIRENLASRREAARQAQQIIEAEVARFTRTLKARDVAPTIRAVREQAVGIRDDVMAQARRMLGAGRAPEDVIEFLGNTLMNKLMHTPSSGLRRAGERGDADMLRAARQLFDLDED
jgi:glutamyl-tRNA reductase